MKQKGTQHNSAQEVPENIFGEGTFVVVDKPLGWTSFDVVNKFRWLLCRRLGVKRLKVGHAGTLDPLATGVVVLCTGRFTKRIEEVQKLPKVYTATLKLGATTPSFDMESEEDATFSTEHITREKVEAVLKQYEGLIPQVPPIFSAVKVAGSRAYQLARRGEGVELQAKEVRIDRIELLEYSLPFIQIRVECGKGTYIRALARDIGASLGCGAYLTALRRESVGAFRASEGIGVEQMEEYIEERMSMD
ncbi:tRNA pseudouridine(55) synthase TruB [uncultured Porphyromonas sp.]|uniref:tRNA pseudouridine(55) synthase TruB n=1 Tax=uncultured Porphyromonas sp. TaxID=159274 RepID=UPI00262DB92A|nr:tRNA pseudouridine(55) synthase TruB [uncultured Porphyromonas sp.]